jgi:hypothetical protein
MSERGWSGWVRYGLPGLALGLFLAWSVGDRGPVAQAQGPQGGAIPIPLPATERGRAVASVSAVPDASGTGTIALTASAGGSAQLLYLIDTRAKAFAVYRVDPANSKGTVKLEAARQYQWDLKLAEYNNSPPDVAAIESTVRSLGQPNR